MANAVLRGHLAKLAGQVRTKSPLSLPAELATPRTGYSDLSPEVPRGLCHSSRPAP